MEKQEKDGMTFWKLQGGFTIVRTPKNRIYLYGKMFGGSWKLYPPVGLGKVTRHNSEESVIEYLSNL